MTGQVRLRPEADIVCSNDSCSLLSRGEGRSAEHPVTPAA